MSVRVAMVVDRFPNETFLARQVAALIERGLDVHVLCQIRDDDAEAWSLLDRAAMKGRIHPWPDRGRWLRLAAATAPAVVGAVRQDHRSLAAAVRRERAAGSGAVGRILFDARVLALAPDVLHFQFGDLAVRRVHAAAIDAAFTTSFRGYDLAYAGLSDPGFYDQLWPALDGAHTLGQDLLERAVGRGCPSGVPWTIIPPAVDPAEFRPRDDGWRTTSTDPFRVVGVGRLHWKKGYTDALTAVGGLRDRGVDIRYRILGTGPDEEAIRWTIVDLGLQDRVELLGHCSPATVRRELRAADAMIHASLTEGFGNSVLEAQASGLPVVCTDAEGLSENVVHGRSGFVVPRRSPRSLEQALHSIADDPALARQLGEFGRRRVLDKFDVSRQTDAFIEFFTAAARS